MAHHRNLSGVEVMSNTARTLFGAVGLLEQETRRIITAHGIPTLAQQGWYPLQTLLLCLNDIRSQIGPYTVHALGQHTARHITFLPSIDSFGGALSSLNEAYRMHHRGTGEIGGFQYQPQSVRSARIRCDNPYPCEFDQGLLEALFELFPPQESFRLRVTHAPEGCRSKADCACVYHLHW
ncbi:hypothetical protein [Stigmatella aurantiaca]|uniref:Conserved uncharacterized protein n=1 Tax=Stigmatella aurantiaca (strain DW4/3-1) TaxID=378806 RepID=E3FER2_STIAD|nr:hypothetical protein [Stigmatella aurantiaca]ADO68893.1 conserved uncharacterized protein [Stigmatella aurantiaca DW4/3-1]